MEEKFLVSIITPVYNSETFLKETINSVIKQTYKNFEMILVDDCSEDKSKEIIEEYVKNDSRIKYYRLKENSGAAVSRNYALEKSNGRFIAYLDADDLWKEDKLEKQIKYMIENGYAFSCTDYKKIDEKGKYLNKIVKIPKKVNYDMYLRNTIIQTVGVMVDTKLTGKELLIMPNLRRRQDAATWCQLLKNGFECYQVPEVLSYYRIVNNSLSSNKFKAVKGTWYLYRNVEKLSLLKSCYCFIEYAINAVKKRIYINEKVFEMLNIKREIRKIITTISPTLTTKLMYKVIMKKSLNLKNPQTFNEKINWLKLYKFPKDEKVIACADKYKVREYIKSKGLERYLVELYNSWENADEIVWDELPDKFVLKCNHGCAYNIISPNKNELIKNDVIKKLNKWLKEDFSKVSAELHYKKVKRKIICEEFLENEILDYKFFCFNGIPKYFYVSQNVDGDFHNMEADFFNIDGTLADFIRTDHKRFKKIPEIPSNLSEMVDVCKVLSEDFHFVRVDLFNIDGKIYFSELTFTPCSGVMPIEPYEADKMLGDLIDLEQYI